MTPQATRFVLVLAFAFRELRWFLPAKGVGLFGLFL